MRTLPSSLAVLLSLSLAAFAADFSAGLDAYQKKDYTKAAKEWRALAEKGDAPSQFNLGLLYVDGLGVPQDYTQAATWFERSAEQDYEKAQLNLGAMYGAGRGVKRDFVQAYKWLNVCAAKGDQKCVAQRDLVAQKLKPKQLVLAQHLASQFAPKQEPGKSDADNPDK
jgi:TPR repeat protein